MRLRHRIKDTAEINLTPLIDVVFLLLIFFMVSTTFNRDSELSIELPEAAAEPQERKPDSIEVAIDAKGRFYVNGRELVNTQVKSIKQALTKAAQAVGNEETPPIVVSADASTPHQAVIAVMDAARQLGFLNLSFPVQISAEEGR